MEQSVRKHCKNTLVVRSRGDCALPVGPASGYDMIEIVVAWKTRVPAKYMLFF